MNVMFCTKLSNVGQLCLDFAANALDILLLYLKHTNAQCSQNMHSKGDFERCLDSIVCGCVSKLEV